MYILGNGRLIRIKNSNLIFKVACQFSNEHRYLWLWCEQDDERGLVVRASSLSVDLGSIPGRVRPKDFKSWYSQLTCLAFSITRDSVKIGQQVCLLCLWGKALNGVASTFEW